MVNYIKKRFSIRVESENGLTTGDFTLDKNIATVIGIKLSSDNDDVLYYRGSFQLTINKQEVFPEHYESKMLMSGNDTDVNKRYYEREQYAAGNGNVKLVHRDNIHNRMPFIPYRVTLYLLCEAAI
jgi:hypothetical protein